MCDPFKESPLIYYHCGCSKAYDNNGYSTREKPAS